MDAPTRRNDADLPVAEGVCRVEVERWRDGATSRAADAVAVEVPVALEYNGVSHTVMLASPLDLEDFGLGFSLTEGIVAAPREMFDVEVIEADEGLRVIMDIAGERFVCLKERRRSLAGRTGCGLCGAESLQQVFRDLAPVASPLRISSAALHGALAALRGSQRLQGITGATHAAAWISPEGDILVVREDVGRHNALDKLIGALAKAGTDFDAGAVVVTSRASYEMVQKAASMGIGLLAAVSAPTDLAIRMADRLNLTLVGFAREGSHATYSHPWRLGGQ